MIQGRSSVETKTFYKKSNSVAKRTVTRRFCTVVEGTCDEAHFSDMLERSSCERYGQVHAPGNPRCVGLNAFTGTMVYNWRVLWWSMPWVARKGWLLKFFCRSLSDHRRDTHLPDERLLVLFLFLGQAVCRDAFMKLTGLGASML